MAVVRGWSVQETTSNQKRKMLKQRLERWTAGKDVWAQGRGGGQSRKQRASEVIPLVPGLVGTCTATVGIKAHDSSRGDGSVSVRSDLIRSE